MSAFNVFALLARGGNRLAIHNVRLVDVQAVQGEHEGRLSRLIVEYSGETAELVGAGKPDEYMRKLAGLELLRLKFSRGAKAKDCKEGMVYLISNSSWPGLLKIGMTTDIAARLESYQIYDPYKQFKVEHYDFCLDRRAAEKLLLERFDIHLVDGEWVKISDALSVISVLRNY